MYIKKLKKRNTYKKCSDSGLMLQGFLSTFVSYFTKVFCFVKTIDFNARRNIIVMPPFEDFTHCEKFSSRSKRLVQSHSLYFAVP